MALSFFSQLGRKPGQSRSDGLPRWSHTGNGSPDATSDRRWQTSLRDCLVSKTFSRILFVAIAVLLLGDILLHSPTRAVLDTYGWAVTRPGDMDNLQKAVEKSDIDWTKFAYCQYVTEVDYLCNSLMVFESLQRVDAKADRVMMYPREWSLSPTEPTPDGERKRKLLLKARDEYKVHLEPIEVQHFEGEATWADSFTKLLAFNQTQYERVLSLDSDATVLQPMDELFLLPSAPVAMPRAYWLEDGQLSSQLVLVEPSKFEFQRIVEAMNNKESNDFDMEIVNDLYAKDCLIVPHRKYDLITGEFHEEKGHRAYLGSLEEVWDPQKALKEAKFLHFSDWPMPKPWQPHTEDQWNKVLPKCQTKSFLQKDCRDQEAWKWAYEDFLKRRERVCGAEFMPGSL